MNQAESRTRPDVGDVKILIPSVWGAAKQGLPGLQPIPSGTGHPLSFHPVRQIVTPMCLGHEAGRYSLTREKSHSSVVTSALMSSLFQVISPISQVGKTEVLLAQGRQNGANEGSSGRLRGHHPLPSAPMGVYQGLGQDLV